MARDPTRTSEIRPFLKPTVRARARLDNNSNLNARFKRARANNIWRTSLGGRAKNTFIVFSKKRIPPNNEETLKRNFMSSKTRDISQSPMDFLHHNAEDFCN